jgi:hypothetical protein
VVDALVTGRAWPGVISGKFQGRSVVESVFPPGKSTSLFGRRIVREKGEFLVGNQGSRGRAPEEGDQLLGKQAERIPIDDALVHDQEESAFFSVNAVEGSPHERSTCEIKTEGDLPEQIGVKMTLFRQNLRERLLMVAELHLPLLRQHLP